MTKRVIDVPWSATQAIGVFVASWIGMPLLVVGLLKALSPLTPQAQFILNRLANNDVTASFILVALDALVGLWLVKRILDRYHVGWREVGLRSVNIGKAVVFVVAALLSFLVLVAGAFALLQVLFPHFNSGQAQVNQFTQPHNAQSLRLSFLALVVIPPFIEETVFRGFIFPALTKRLGLIGGAVVTSVLFAVAHWQLNVSIYTLILSLLLCFMYYKLRSIWPGIVLHMLNNYIAFAAIIHSK